MRKRKTQNLLKELVMCFLVREQIKALMTLVDQRECEITLRIQSLQGNRNEIVMVEF